MLNAFVDINIIKPFISLTKKISHLDDNKLHNELEHQIFRIIDEDAQKNFAYVLSLNARIYDILVILSRSLAHTVNLNDLQYGIKKVHGLDKLNHVFKYIDEHYQDNITLKDIAKIAGFSEYHFSRIFKEITEKNFHIYINEFRIKKAEKMLANTSISIAQAAYDTGFNSVATFNRIFKRVKGCTPSQYKAMRA